MVEKAKEMQGMYGKKTILFIDEIHRFNKGQQDYLLPFVEMYLAVFAALCGHYPQFHRIQGMPGIPSRQIWILFIDEIHRFNKGQQDYLLPFVEDGTVILIGATTENPYFEVNGALISRSVVFELKPLAEEDIRALIKRALSDNDRGMGAYEAVIDEDALDFLADLSGGDARHALNAVDCHHRRIAFWRTCHIGNCLRQNNLRLRHSHPLYGEGGANRHLKGCRIRIPHVFRCANHNTPCNKYDYPNHYVKQQYLPYELSGREFYKPSGNGYEAKIREHMARINTCRLNNAHFLLAHCFYCHPACQKCQTSKNNRRQPSTCPFAGFPL